MARGQNNHGPAVLDGVVLRTSVSALTAFDPESYGGCPRRWWWTRVAGVKEEETVAQKAGTDAHAELETYLSTGVDVLGPVVRAGKHLLPRPGADLVIEKEFGDLGAAIEWRKRLVKTPQHEHSDLALLEREITRVAGLTAGGIPLDGYIDFRHARGEYVDSDGLVKKERSEHGIVVEVGDHKTTSSIENFAKSPEEMASTIQMIGYANYVLNIDSIIEANADHVRVSHIYYQTRGPKLAKKVTALLSARAARDGWRRVDQLAGYMEEVARAKRVEDVEPQTKSCDAYRGCPHVARCPITRKLGTGGSSMSLFGNTNTNGSTSSSTPPASTSQGSLFNNLLKKDAPVETPKATETTSGGSSLFGAAKVAPSEDPAHRAAVEAEKQKLAAEDRGETMLTKSTIYTSVAVTACVLDQEYFVETPNGKQKMKFAGSSKGFFFFVDGQGGRVRLEIADDVFECLPGAGTAVTPPDAPKSTMPSAAAPLKPEQIARIEDPEVKQRAEEHAKQVAEQAQTTQGATQGATAPVEKTSGRCPEGGKKVALTDDNLANQSVVCVCGKDWKLKQAGAVKEGNTWFATLPSHNIKGKVVTAPAPTVVPTSTVQPQPVVQQAPVVQSTQAQPASVASSDLFLFVDIAVERGPALTPLDAYYLPIVRGLEEQHGAADIRCAPQDSALAFGKWKGALAATVRAQPPSPGTYSAQSSSEVAQVVIEALAPMCTAVMRGMR